MEDRPNTYNNNSHVWLTVAQSRQAIPAASYKYGMFRTFSSVILVKLSSSTMYLL